MKKAMTGTSWTPDCPVRLADLSAVRVTYFGFDNTVHDGIIVLHKRFAEDALAVFDELYAIRFPINNVAPWCYYCRKADDTPEEWSGHAYGIAIDVNPLAGGRKGPVPVYRAMTAKER